MHITRVSTLASQPGQHVIDLDALSPMPSHDPPLRIREEDQLPGRARGVIDLATASIGLLQVDGQLGGGACAVRGHDMHALLANERVLGAHVLDYLLQPARQHLIPEAWRGNSVFFWGTVYWYPTGIMSGKNVRAIHWLGGRWSIRDFDVDWGDTCFAAVLMSE